MKKYRYAGISLQNKRNSNMDSLLLKEHMVGDMPALLAVVCDGEGSTGGGAFAASFATRSLADWLEHQQDAACIGLRMRDTVTRINEDVVQTSKQNNLSAASTLSALLLLNRHYYIVHVGDSRIYACGHTNVLQLTVDQVSQSGKLAKWIGFKRPLVPFYEEGSVRNGTFLLCTDGGYRRMDETHLLSELNGRRSNNQKKLVACLAGYVIQRCEQDNVTLAVVTCES